MRFVWVGLAGAVGSVARYVIGLGVDQQRFPWATLTINLAGSFALGAFLTLALDRLPESVVTPVAVGLIGGFTTFSTFAWESFTLGHTGRLWTAAVYVAVSVLGGLAAASLGFVVARAIR